MPTVNNTTGLYTILGYNFDDPNGYVQVMSADTESHMVVFVLQEQIT